jgi:glycosyltransferase involved in cell wall biosynthesis
MTSFVIAIRRSDGGCGRFTDYIVVQPRFVISGSGPEKDAVVARAHENGVAHAIVFLDTLSRGEYIDLMRVVDIVALPSRNEPFGIVALEAWAAGKPVVARSRSARRRSRF